MISSSNKKIAFNTGMLYIRMFFIMAISVYTSRVILQTLGVVDYGLNNLVGGVVGTFTFIVTSLAVSVQRYLSIAIGKSDLEQFAKILKNGTQLYLKFSIGIVLLSELAGYFFLLKLNIPHDRIFAAQCVFQLSLFGLFLSINSGVYQAVLRVKEDFSKIALISIFEASLRLIIVFLLTLSSSDKLIIFAILNFAISCISYGLTRIVTRKYSEMRLKSVMDKQLTKELLSFSSWNLVGTLSVIARSQGTVVLLNLFFGVMINAAYAIASQIKLAIEGFSANFLSSVIPQIMQNYGSGNMVRMREIISTSTKMGFYLLFIISFPIIAEIDFFLKLWLKTPPLYSNIFSILILINALIDVISTPLLTGIQASGKIKTYQIVVGGLLILNFPISYLVFKLGGGMYSAVIISILLSIVKLILQLLFAKKLYGLNIKFFVLDIILPSLLSVLIVSSLSYSIIYFFSPCLMRFILVLISSTFVTIGIGYLIGLNSVEKSFVKNIVLLTYQNIMKRK